MKSITKILIAFMTITMIITPAMGYEIYEQNDDQPAIWWDEDPSYNEWIHHRTIQPEGWNAYHPMPTGLDDMRASFSDAFPF